MKILHTLVFVAFFGQTLFAQCSSLDLAALQGLGRADASVRESKILDLGFDIHKDMLSEGASVRAYRKCLAKSNGQRPVFGQIVLWDKNSDLLVFLTLDAAEAQSLRQSIESRRTGSSEGDAYVGRMFEYRFFTQQFEGQSYQATSIALRN